MFSTQKKPATKKPARKPETKKLRDEGTGSLKFSRKPKQKPKSAAEDTVSGNGTIVLSKSKPLGIAVAWLVLVFVLIGAFLGIKGAVSPPVQAAPIVETGLTVGAQQAGDYARSFVGSWLRATREDASGLGEYRTIGQGEITQKQPVEFRELSVASIDTNDSGISAVVISADLLVKKETMSGDKKTTAETWEPSWFQVNVFQSEDGKFSILQWPTPIAPPAAGEDLRTGYRYEGSKEVETTAEAFFQAYILGQGDVSRLVNPETEIQPLGPNPYKVALVQKILTDEDHRDEVPKDGTVSRALITVAIGESELESRTANYALTLETRGGRWEVTAIDSSPLLVTNATAKTDSVTESASPSQSAN